MRRAYRSKRCLSATPSTLLGVPKLDSSWDSWAGLLKMQISENLSKVNGEIFAFKREIMQSPSLLPGAFYEVRPLPWRPPSPFVTLAVVLYSCARRPFVIAVAKNIPCQVPPMLFIIWLITHLRGINYVSQLMFLEKSSLTLPALSPEDCVKNDTLFWHMLSYGLFLIN